MSLGETFKYVGAMVNATAAAYSSSAEWVADDSSCMTVIANARLLFGQRTIYVCRRALWDDILVDDQIGKLTICIIQEETEGQLLHEVMLCQTV